MGAAGGQLGALCPWGLHALLDSNPRDSSGPAPPGPPRSCFSAGAFSSSSSFLFPICNFWQCWGWNPGSHNARQAPSPSCALSHARLTLLVDPGKRPLLTQSRAPRLQLLRLSHPQSQEGVTVRGAGTGLCPRLSGFSSQLPASRDTRVGQAGHRRGAGRQVQGAPRVTRAGTSIIPGRPRNPCTKPAGQSSAARPRWATSWARGPRGSPAW